MLDKGSSLRYVFMNLGFVLVLDKGSLFCARRIGDFRVCTCAR